VVSAFYVGLAALQVGDDVHADSRLSEVTRLVPPEPAGWANWGILALRQRNYDIAAQRLDRARDLAPQNDRIYDLLGILDSQRGQSAQAIADLHKAVELNPKNLRALYERKRRNGRAMKTGQPKFGNCAKILAASRTPAAALELSRIAAKRGDGDAIGVAQIGASSMWCRKYSINGRRAVGNRRGHVRRDPDRCAVMVANIARPDRDQSASQDEAGLHSVPETQSPTFRPAPARRSTSMPALPDLGNANAEKSLELVGAIPLGVRAHP
jgi:tetratricopeptide (TPR) repeat protein